MKHILMASAIFTSLILNAHGFGVLNEDKRYGRQKIIRDEVKVEQSSTTNKVQKGPDKGIVGDLQGQIKELKSSIDHLKKENEKKEERIDSGVYTFGNGLNIQMLDEFDGVIPNSDAFYAQPNEVVVVSNENSGPLEGYKLKCRGSLVAKRVKVFCSKMIGPSGVYSIKAVLRDGHDGGASVKPSKIFTGENVKFFKGALATLTGSMFHGATDRAQTDLGDIPRDNAKNEILNAFSKIGDDVRQEMRDDIQEIETVAIVNSGKPVSIQFLEGVKNED